MMASSKHSIAATFLFVPGDRPERFGKAFSAGADAVILDLEDAVADARKGFARSSVVEFIASNRQMAMVRLNAADSQHFEADLDALSSQTLGGVLVAKAENSATIERIAHRLPGVPLFPLIETARGFANMAAICGAAGVARLIFGTVDFQLDLGIEGDGDELSYYRSALVLQSKLAGLAGPVDGVSLVLDNPAVLASESVRARRLGFSGKLCIHPRQVEPVAGAFKPNADDLQRARRIVDAGDSAKGGAVSLDGRMIDRPVLEAARRMIKQN